MFLVSSFIGRQTQDGGHTQDTPTCTSRTDLTVRCNTHGNLHARPVRFQPDRKSTRIEVQTGKKPADAPGGLSTDTLGGLVIIITTRLLQAAWNDLPCSSLCTALLLPLHQPEGTKDPKRPFDGWSAAWIRACTVCVWL